MHSLKETITNLVFSILSESKQNIISLGFPAVIANLLWREFGKNAFLIAKWYKVYTTHGNETKDWFRYYSDNSILRHDISLSDMIDLYEAALANDEKKYNDLREKNGFWIDPDEPFDLKENADLWLEEIEKKFFDKIFFGYSIVKDIRSGKLKDLGPYKNLDLYKAQEKYDEKFIFQEAEAVKTYDNGWRWINVGPKNTLVGQMMKNCGSAGCMSWDEKKTLLVLFDTNQKPHVIVTYSPTEKRISGDEGIGSTPVKDEYEDYVLDLAKTLGAKYDYDKSKSIRLRIKGILGDKLESITKIHETMFDQYFLITLKTGKQYYSNGLRFIEKGDLDKEKDKYDELGDMLSGGFFSDRNPKSPSVGAVKLLGPNDL